MTVQTLPKTKKERIKELVLAGLGPEQIAAELHTTRDYVYKEKGKLKKKGLTVVEQSLSVSDGSHNVTVIKNHDPSELVSLDHNGITNSMSNIISDYDISPMDKNEVKSMYSAFMENKDGPYVSAKYGVRPDISQREHIRYLAERSRDPFELQHKILSKLSNPPPAIQEIISKSATGNLLTNDELLLVIDLISISYSSEFLKTIIANPTIAIPLGLNRIECRQCHQGQAGVIYDSRTYAGNITKGLVSNGHLCNNCRSLASQAFEEYKRTYGMQ